EKLDSFYEGSGKIYSNHKHKQFSFVKKFSSQYHENNFLQMAGAWKLILSVYKYFLCQFVLDSSVLSILFPPILFFSIPILYFPILNCRKKPFFNTWILMI